MRFRARSQLISTHGIARWRRPFTALTSPAPASRSRPVTAYQGHWPDARTPMRPPIGRCDGVRPPRQLEAPSTRIEATEDPKINSCGQNRPPRPRTSTRPMMATARANARIADVAGPVQSICVRRLLDSALSRPRFGTNRAVARQAPGHALQSRRRQSKLRR